MTGYRSLARNRDFTTLWVGETVSELGSRMSAFVFPLVAFAITGSTVAAALVEAVYLLGLAGVLLPAGVWADRFHRRTLMVGASATGAATYLSLAVAGATGHLSLPHLTVAGLVSGVAAGVFSPAQMSAIRAIVATEDLPTALAQNQARGHVAGLLGGPLGGALYAVTRWLPFAVDAVSYAVSCLTLSRIRTDLAAHPRPDRTPMRSQLADGLRFILARPFFRVLMTWSALVNLLTNATFFVLVLALIQAGRHPVEIGLIETAAGLGGIVGAIAAPYLIDRLPTGTLTVLIAWMVALPLVPMIWWLTPPVAVAGTFLLMLLTPAGSAGIGAYRVSITPDHLQGRVAATSQFAAMGVMPLSPVLGGLLLARYGAQTAVVALVVATLALALLPTLSRSIRSVRRPRDWVSEPVPAGA